MIIKNRININSNYMLSFQIKAPANVQILYSSLIFILKNKKRLNAKGNNVYLPISYKDLYNSMPCKNSLKNFNEALKFLDNTNLLTIYQCPKKLMIIFPKEDVQYCLNEYKKKEKLDEKGLMEMDSSTIEEENEELKEAKKEEIRDQHRKSVKGNLLNSNEYKECSILLSKLKPISPHYNKHHVMLFCDGANVNNKHINNLIFDKLFDLSRNNKHIHNVLNKYKIVKNSQQLKDNAKSCIHNLYKQIFFSSNKLDIDTDDFEVDALAKGFKAINSNAKYLYIHSKDWAIEPTKKSTYYSRFDVANTNDLLNILILNIFQLNSKICYLGGDRDRF